MIYFEQFSKEEVKSPSTSTLFIKASRMDIASTMEVVKTHVESCDANILLWCEIHLEWTTSEIKIFVR